GTFGSFIACSSDNTTVTPGDGGASEGSLDGPTTDTATTGDASDGGSPRHCTPPKGPECSSDEGCSTFATTGIDAAVCRKACTSDTQCNAGTEHCGGLAPTAASGLCQPTCSAFPNNCPSGFDCSSWTTSVGAATFFPVCRYIRGTTRAFEACTGPDCIEGYV